MYLGPAVTTGPTRSLLFLLAALLAPPALGDCPAGRWVTLAPMPEARQELAAAALDGRVYAVGGLVGRANAADVYDPASNRWTTIANLPAGTDHAWAVSHAGRLYVGGGTSNRVFSYDPIAGTWSEVASSVFVHGGTPAAAVIGGRIYVAGGAGGGMVGNEVEAYDPSANRWTTLASMSCARNHTAGGVLNGRLHVAGGRPGNQSCHEAYDPTTNAWTPRAPLPTGRSGIAGAVAGGCFYVFGGEGNVLDAAGIFHEVEAYEAATDTWTRLPPMAVGRHGISAAVIANLFYFPGGATSQGFGATPHHDVYVIDPPVSIPREPVVLSPRRRRD
jgi:N-acetylneuraminic acid mutarotase